MASPVMCATPMAMVVARDSGMADAMVAGPAAHATAVTASVARTIETLRGGVVRMDAMLRINRRRFPCASLGRMRRCFLISICGHSLRRFPHRSFAAAGISAAKPAQSRHLASARFGPRGRASFARRGETRSVSASGHRSTLGTSLVDGVVQIARASSSGDARPHSGAAVFLRQ